MSLRGLSLQKSLKHMEGHKFYQAWLLTDQLFAAQLMELKVEDGIDYSIDIMNITPYFMQMGVCVSKENGVGNHETGTVLPEDTVPYSGLEVHYHMINVEVWACFTQENNNTFETTICTEWEWEWEWNGMGWRREYSPFNYSLAPTLPSLRHLPHKLNLRPTVFRF